MYVLVPAFLASQHSTDRQQPLLRCMDHSSSSAVAVAVLHGRMQGSLRRHPQRQRTVPRFVWSPLIGRSTVTSHNCGDRDRNRMMDGSYFCCLDEHTCDDVGRFMRQHISVSVIQSDVTASLELAESNCNNSVVREAGQRCMCLGSHA